MNNCVADSSFYICLADDMGQKICVHKFLDYYKFHIGPVILNEISRSFSKDKVFKSKTKKIDYDYSLLFEPLIKGDLNKGEYEAIGIAKFLLEGNKLRLIILDDGPAKNLLRREFPGLEKYQCGTVGFMRECCKDGNISKNKAINTLILMQKKILNNKNPNKRICGITPKDQVRIIDPTIEEIRKVT